jgi:cytochrome P450
MEESLSFGCGAQACPGMFFASREIKLMFATLLLRYYTKWDAGNNGTEALAGEYMVNSLKALIRSQMFVRRKEG